MWRDLRLPIILLLLRAPQAQTTNDTASLPVEATAGAQKANASMLNQLRTLRCIPILRLFNLELRHGLNSGELVGLTGSHERLGEWRVEKSVEMQRHDKDGLKWHLRTTLCASERIYYRYFIYHLDEWGNKRIRRWEGHQHARVLQSYDIARQMDADIFGEAYRESLVGVEQERGWLRCEYMIELKFVWERHLHFGALSGVDQEEDYKYVLRLEVSPEDRVTMTRSHTTADTEFEVARYAYNRSHFRRQRVSGTPYTQGDVLIFRIIEPLKVRQTYQLTIADSTGSQLGVVYVRAEDLRSTSGVLRLPIHAVENDLDLDIGFLRLPYLVVLPLPKAGALNFRASFHHYWPLNWPSLDVAHRGMGNSFYGSQASHTENTISSLLHAHLLHADMVEFDVQVTQDYQPVLWNEPGFYTAPHGRKVRAASDVHYVLIQSISYSKLKSRRVFVFQHSLLVELTDLNVKEKSQLERLFPPLVEVYSSLPKSLGLMVEIKWPQLLLYEDQQFQKRPLLDKNHYVDRLLDISLKEACGRPLIFTSLDADICTLLRHKQQLFPVMFLSSGDSVHWQPYMDLRTTNFREAVNFAQSEELLGTAPHAEELLDSQEDISLGLALRQAVFVWGKSLNSTRALRKFQHAQVSGLIYDGFERHVSSRKRVGFFGAPELREIFARQCYNPISNQTRLDQGSTCLASRRIKLRGKTK